MMEDKGNKDGGNMDYNQNHFRNFQGGKKNYGYGNKKMKRKTKEILIITDYIVIMGIYINEKKRSHGL